MKNDNLFRAILIALFSLFLGISCFAQSAQDSVKLAKTGTLIGKETKSGKTYQLFQGSKGGKFLIRLSAKSGKWYKMYLPKETATGK
jgi:hypothetical protein